MNVIFVLLPTIVLVIGAVVFINKKTSKLLSVKITHWLFMIYVSVLLLAMCGSFFIQGKEIRMEKAERVDLFPLLSSGKIEEIPEIHLLKEETISFTEDELTITSTRGDLFHSVYIEEKEDNDGKIEVYIYGNLQVNSSNFTEKLISPKMELVDKKILIQPIDSQEIKIVTIKKEFVMNQLGDEVSLFGEGLFIDYPHIYLRIPKGLNIIEDPNLFFEYVNKSNL